MAKHQIGAWHSGGGGQVIREADEMQLGGAHGALVRSLQAKVIVPPQPQALLSSRSYMMQQGTTISVTTFSASIASWSCPCCIQLPRPLPCSNIAVGVNLAEYGPFPASV